MQTLSMFSRDVPALLAGCVIALSGCASSGGSSSDASDAMMQSFQEYKNAWNNHDVPTLVGFYGENGTYTNPGTGQVSGEPFAQWVGALFTAIPDFHVEVLSADPVDEDTLAEQWVITGTWTEPFPGGPLAGAKPTGKSFQVPGAEIQEWDDGQIRSANAYYDQMAFLTQIGVIPPPGQSPRASAE